MKSKLGPLTKKAVKDYGWLVIALHSYVADGRPRYFARLVDDSWPIADVTEAINQRSAEAALDALEKKLEESHD